MSECVCQAGYTGTACAACEASTLCAVPSCSVVLATGSTFSCSLGFSRGVRCWGHNHAGQSGLGDTTNRGDTSGEMGASSHSPADQSGRHTEPPPPTSSGIESLNRVRWMWQANLPAVALGEAAVALSLGVYNACAILVTGEGGSRVGSRCRAGVWACHVVCRGVFAIGGCDARWSRKRESVRSAPAWWV